MGFDELCFREVCCLSLVARILAPKLCRHCTCILVFYPKLGLFFKIPLLFSFQLEYELSPTSTQGTFSVQVLQQKNKKLRSISVSLQNIFTNVGLEASLPQAVKNEVLQQNNSLWKSIYCVVKHTILLPLFLGVMHPSTTMPAAASPWDSPTV